MLCGGFGSPLDKFKGKPCQCMTCEWCSVRKCDVGHWGDAGELCAACEDVFMVESDKYHRGGGE